MHRERKSPKDLHDFLRRHPPEPGDQWLWKKPASAQQKSDLVVRYLDSTERVELKPENYEGKMREVSLATLAKSYQPGDDIVAKYEDVAGVPKMQLRLRRVVRPGLSPVSQRVRKIRASSNRR